MRLTLDPETGDEYAEAARIHAWRIVLKHGTAGGRPRVVKDENGPIAIPPESTEEQVLDVIEQLGVEVGDMEVSARALDVNGRVLFDRAVDTVADDGEAQRVPQSMTEETVQRLAAALVASQASMQTLVDRLASSNERLAGALAGSGADDDEAPEENGFLEKLSRFISDDDIDMVREEIRKHRRTPAKEPPRDVTPKQEE